MSNQLELAMKRYLETEDTLDKEVYERYITEELNKKRVSTTTQEPPFSSSPTPKETEDNDEQLQSTSSFLVPPQPITYIVDDIDDNTDEDDEDDDGSLSSLKTHLRPGNYLAELDIRIGTVQYRLMEYATKRHPKSFTCKQAAKALREKNIRRISSACACLKSNSYLVHPTNDIKINEPDRYRWVVPSEVKEKFDHSVQLLAFSE